MIKTRLIGQVPSSKKYIALTVLIMDSGKIAEQGDGSLADGYLNKQFKIIGE